MPLASTLKIDRPVVVIQEEGVVESRPLAGELQVLVVAKDAVEDQ